MSRCGGAMPITWVSNVVEWSTPGGSVKVGRWSLGSGKLMQAVAGVQVEPCTRVEPKSRTWRGGWRSYGGNLMSAEPGLALTAFSSLFLAPLLGPMAVPTNPTVMSLESRSLHLSTLVREAEQRVNELTAQVVNEAPNTDCSEKEKQLKAWEWRYRLYKRMKAGFEHARECPQEGLSGGQPLHWGKEQDCVWSRHGGGSLRPVARACCMGAWGVSTLGACPWAWGEAQQGH